MSPVSLGSVAEINPRSPSVAPDEPVSFVGLAELDAATARARPRETRPYREVAKGYTVFRDSDILLARITPSWENGKVGIAELAHPIGVGSTEFHVVRVGEELDRRYALHLLRQPQVRFAGAARMTGSGGQRRVPADFLRELEIELPALAQQRRIAAILDGADAIRQRRRSLLDHLDSLVASIFHETVDKAAARIRLGELVAEFRYGTSRKSSGTGLPTLRIPNVIGGAIDLTEIKMVDVSAAERLRLQLSDGDLLFVRTNGNPDYVGRAAVFSGEAVAPAGYGDTTWLYASYLIRARLQSGAEPHFVKTFLATAEGRRQLRAQSKTSAGQYNINIEGLSAVEIPDVPPPVQRAFRDRTAPIDSLRQQIKSALAADEELFASLQQRAFAGDL